MIEKWKALDREHKRAYAAIAFLIAVAIFCFSRAAFATQPGFIVSHPKAIAWDQIEQGNIHTANDSPTPATADIPPYHHWMLSSQDFNARTGYLLGPRKSFPCRAHWDYLHGIIKSLTDCSKSGYYKTALECSLAQSGRLAKARRIRSDVVGTVWFCYHPGQRLGGV